MNTIRTTISLEETLHRQLSTQAFTTGQTLSQVINAKLKNPNLGKSSVISLKQDLALFARLGTKAGKTDWVKLVRAERDRDK